MSLVKDLERYFERFPDQWHHKGTILKMEWKDEKGKEYEKDNISRRLRDLEQESIIAVKYEKAMSLYRFIPASFRSRYVTSSQRPKYSNVPMWREPEPATTIPML